MSGRLHTSRVLVVEGKYDAARLARLTDATLITSLERFLRAGIPVADALKAVKSVRGCSKSWPEKTA